MPIPDNPMDRLKEALVPGLPTAQRGAPMLVTGDPAAWTPAPQVSAVNASQVLNRNPVTGTITQITGFEVALYGAGGAKTEVTVTLLGSGGAILYQTLFASGAAAPISRGFPRPINAGLEASVQLAVGPAGASMFTIANLIGYQEGVPTA